MGGLFSKVLSSLSSILGPKQAKILILGLDNAGKTTILYRFQINETIETIPTLAFNVETIQYKNIKFQVWDLGGQTSIRPYWRCYFLSTSALIYVVDAAAPERLDVAREELHLLLDEEGLADTVLLVYANKQDLPNALSPADITERLELTKIRNRSWTVFGTSAVNGTGITEGLDWLSSELQRR